MNFASLFNYVEAGLWFIMALTVFIRSKNLQPELKRLANILSVSFILFSISDIVEASTGAWWKPLWLLGLKGLCVLSFVCSWIKYSQHRSELNFNMQIPAKLKWQCRRGTQELDKLLTSYLENEYLNAALIEQQQFQQLLNLEDNELLQLFFNECQLSQRELNHLIEKIRHSATIHHQ